jgi:PAS domain S-box-containing protein
MDRPEMFEEMVETVGVGVGFYGADGRYLYVNRAYAEMLETDRESLVGTPIWELIPAFDADRFDDYWASFEDGKTRTTETVHEYESRSVPVSTVTTRKRIAGDPYNFGTIRDISELRERERELQEQNERLEAFTGVVSHDLRNPLNVAKGYLELLQEDIDRDELALIESSLDRMELLIDDLLRLARGGNTIDEPEPVSLTAVAAAARNIVEMGDATVTMESDLRFRADESRLQQLLENLLRNSVEHGPEDVTMTVGALDDGAGFYVTDDGPGIPPEERESVFSPTTSDSSDGSGLGLAIVNEIVEAHGWDISVTESSEGGARFEVTGVETV